MNARFCVLSVVRVHAVKTMMLMVSRCVHFSALSLPLPSPDVYIVVIVYCFVFIQWSSVCQLCANVYFMLYIQRMLHLVAMHHVKSIYKTKQNLKEKKRADFHLKQTKKEKEKKNNKIKLKLSTGHVSHQFLVIDHLILMDYWFFFAHDFAIIGLRTSQTI